MIAARFAASFVHSLLNYAPMPIDGREEGMQIKIKSILDGRAVDFCDQPARSLEGCGIDAGHIADLSKFMGRAARLGTLTAANVQSKFALDRSKTAFQGADDARGDAGRMPIHAHDGAEGLEPERMRQPLQEFVAAVVVDDRLSDDGAERRHPGRQPRRDPSAMQG